MNSRLPLIAALLLAGAPAVADAQVRLPVIFPLRGSTSPRQAAPATAVPPVSQGGLIAAAGGDTVYFAGSGAVLDPTATPTLARQARWLLANPGATVRLEGHGGDTDSRDYALAIGDRRANAVRDFLVSLGVAPQRISVLSWGKERPGHVLIGQSLVETGARVQTIVIPPPPPVLPPPVPRQP